MTPERAARVLAKFLLQHYEEESLHGPLRDAIKVVLGKPPILEQAPTLELELDLPAAKLLCDCYGLAIIATDRVAGDEEMLRLLFHEICDAPTDTRIALVRAMTVFQREAANARLPGLGDLMGTLQEAFAKVRGEDRAKKP